MENNEINEPESPVKKTGKKKIPLATKIVAKVLTETGMSQVEAAKELGMSVDTIQRAIKDPNLDRAIIENAKMQLPVKMYNVAFKIAERLDADPTIIAKLNPYMGALVLGIMIDKARLMQGQSTENLELQGKVVQIQTALTTIAEMRKKLSVPPDGLGN